MDACRDDPDKHSVKNIRLQSFKGKIPKDGLLKLIFFKLDL